jgi:hypothetical protein
VAGSPAIKAILSALTTGKTHDSDFQRKFALDFSQTWFRDGFVMVAVAQSVEPQIVILVVAGSSPVGHPIFLIPSFSTR